MSSREVSPSGEGAERRSYGRLPDSLLIALHPLLHQYNATPLQMCLRVGMPQPIDSSLCQRLAQVSGLEILPVATDREEIVGELVRPLLNQLVAQVSARPGSVWVPDSQSLWAGLSRENRASLVQHAIRQIKLRMTPAAQRFRCYPAGLCLTVSMPDPEQEAVLDAICEVTGWDVRSIEMAEFVPDGRLFEQALAWDELLGADELDRLRPMLRKHEVEPFQLSILLAMADPKDWRTRQEVTEVTGLPVQPFQVEEEEIAAALHEKVGSAQEDLWRQVAIMPLFFQLDRLAPLLEQHEVLPLKLTLRIGMANPKDHLALHQIRLLTGLEVEPVEMTGPAIVSIVERMLRTSF